MSFSDLPPRVVLGLKTALQVVLLSLTWVLANWISHSFLPILPASLLGLLLVLILLGLKVVRGPWLAGGASWLLSTMLLFFVPSVVSMLEHQQLLRENGVGILVVIVGSTVLVMVATALAVDWTWKFEARRKAAKATSVEGDQS